MNNASETTATPTAPRAAKVVATFTVGQHVEITRGIQRGLTGKVYAIMGLVHIVEFDGGKGGYGRESWSGKAASLKAI